MARTKSSSALSFVVVISLAAIKAAVLHLLSAPHRRLASMSRSPSPFGGPDAFDNFGAGGKLHATQGASGTAALPGQPMHRLPAGHLKQKARAWANLRAKTRATAESQAKAKAVGANAVFNVTIDAETETVRTIPCGVEGRYKWIGIAAVGTKLYCAPCAAS